MIFSRVSGKVERRQLTLSEEKAAFNATATGLEEELHGLHYALPRQNFRRFVEQMELRRPVS